MLLEELARYARAKNLISTPGYEERPIRWLIHLDAAGSFFAVTETVGSSTKGGRKGKPKSVPAPIAPAKRTSGIAAAPFVDNAKYVFGYTADGNKPARDAECATAFRAILRNAADATGDEIVIAALSFLERYDRGEFRGDTGAGSGGSGKQRSLRFRD